MGVETFLEGRGLSFELLSSRLELDGDDVLFVTGTLVDETGGAESELDVHLLTTEQGLRKRAARFAPELRKPHMTRRVGTLYERIGHIELDIEVHLRGTFEALLDALDTLDPWNRADVVDSFESLGGFDRDAAVELLHRLRVGHAAGNAAAFAKLRARLDDRKLAVWNVHHALIRSAEAMAGTRASLRQSDSENAYLKLSALYDALGDAYLFSRGQSIDRWKWRLPRLRALGKSPFLEHYRDVRLMRHGDHETLAEFVERQLEAARLLSEQLRSEVGIKEPGASSCALGPL